MTVLAERSERARPTLGTRSGLLRSADATTVLAIFVALQPVLPSRLVMNGIPLDLSAPSLVAGLLGALWICARMTTPLGAASGRDPVRTLLVASACVLVASYARWAAAYLEAVERAIGDHTMVTVFALIFVGLAVCDGV